MGKQLYFAHTEDDVCQLLNFLENMRVKIIINSVLYDPSELYTRILTEMSAFRNAQYSLVLAQDESKAKTLKEVSIVDGTAVEMMNCWKWSCNSCTYYDKGRIYLSKSKDGDYDRQALALYNKLCSYFKRNYVYFKELGIYYSLDFKSKFDMRQIYISQLGHPINI